MPIELNDNVKIKAGKPAEPKSFYSDNKAYLNTAQVLATVPVAERHEYLPVNVVGVQYWFLPDLVTLVKIPSNITVDVPLTFINGVVSLSYDPLTLEVQNSKIQVKHGVFPELDEQGKVPAANLPGVIPDVIEVANYAALPAVGVSAVIYITIDDLKQYRWGGSVYALLSASLVLGDLSSNAYPGNKGKIAYDHTFNNTTNPHNVTKSQVGLSNADNTSDINKPVSTAQQIELDKKSNTGHHHPISDVDLLTEALAARVVGPAGSANNVICIFDGTTGKLIKVTNVTIDANGQMVINAQGVGLTAIADYLGLEAVGGTFGLSGISPNVPAQFANSSTETTGRRRGMVLRGDSAHVQADNGYAIDIEWRLPCLGWDPAHPELSEIPGGYISCVLTDNTQFGERSDFQYWLQDGGVLKHVATLTSKGQYQINSLKLNPLATPPANPTGGEMYHNVNGHVYKFNASTLVWDDMESVGTAPGQADITLTSADGSVKINKYDLSVQRAELELFADNESELLTAWGIAIASGKAARIYITNNITFTANRQFIQSYSAQGIKIEAITNRWFIAGNFTIDFNNVVLTNIVFRTTGPYYLRVVGGVASFQNCGWIDEAIDTGARKKNIVVIGPITSGTSKIIIKTPTHFSQSSASNIADLIQPLWISCEAAWSNAASERIYVEIREMAAVFDAARFARVLLTSTQANCPYSVTGDASWFYSPDQPTPGTSNIKSSAVIAKFTTLKVYSGLLNQAGTAAPVATIFKNDVAAPGWIRTAAGTFTLTKAGAFPAGKSIPVKCEEYFDTDGNKFRLTWISADQYKLETFAAINTDVLADGVLVNRSIYIEVNI